MEVFYYGIKKIWGGEWEICGIGDSEVFCFCIKFIEVFVELVIFIVVGVRVKVEGILKWYVKVIRYSLFFVYIEINL